MSRTVLNFWLDTLLAIAFVAGLFALAVLKFVFPPATAAAGWKLWSWTYDQWFNFLALMLSIFGSVVVLHVMLHWSWVCGVIGSRLVRAADGKKRAVDEGTQTLYGVIFLVGLLIVLGVGLAASFLTIQGPA